MSTETMNIRDWLKALGVLCAGNMAQQDAMAKLQAYEPLLRLEFSPKAFTPRSLSAVATKCQFFPSFAELVRHLNEWASGNRPTQSLAITDGVTGLEPEERSWLAYWHKRQAEGFAPLREPDGRLSRPDVADWRRHTASLVRRIAPNAWAVIDREGEAA